MKKILLVLILSLIIFMVVDLTSADLATGLTAHYPFNGNANDESGNEHHGTTYGTALTTDRFGNSNSAYNFDGNDRISVPDAPFLRVQTMTLSAWIKPAIDMNDGQQRVIVSKERQGSAGGYYLAYTHNDTFDSAVNFKIMSGGMSATGYHNTYHTMDLEADQWYHIVGTYDGVNRNLYINGVLIESITETITLFHDSEPIQIGAQAPGSHSFWNGVIDDVRIYNRALTAVEIQQLYYTNMPRIYLPIVVR